MPLFWEWVPIQHNEAADEAYLRAMFYLDPSNRLATIHQRQRYRETGQADRQRSDSIGRTVLQTVRPKMYATLRTVLKFNAAILSSAAVERLFLIGRDILRAI